MTTILRTAAILIALTLAGIQPTTAFAATVSLDPSSATVDENGQFTVDLTMDARAVTVSSPAAPGAQPGLFEGSVVIDFDPGLVQYDGFSISAPATLASGPTIGSDGGLQTVSIGFSNFSAPSDAGVIGTFSFTAMGAIDDIMSFGLNDGFFLGSFANLLPSNQKFFPDITGTAVEITAIPVPAAAWLMLSGLGVIGLGARRRRP